MSLILAVWYNSLKGILEKLQEHETVRTSTHLSERIHTALLFLEEAGNVVDAANQENDELRIKLSECLELPKGHIEKFNTVLPHYENMHKAGGNPEFIAKVALLDGLDIVQCIKLLRTLFHYELEEAHDLIKRLQH